MPGFPVHHQLPELTQTHVHRGSDAIQSLKKASVDYFCPRNTTNNFANQTILTPASVLVPIIGTMLILSL